ncbi:MAG: hypothetical protein FWD74_00965 [Actinomycetia bacterium]|nr:hypothetical protein [Actinomycetes bacterium]
MRAHLSRLRDTREIGPAVISYRDGKDNPIWSVELRGGSSGVAGAVVITWAPVGLVGLPSIEIDLDDGQKEGGAGS